jgi:protein MpaA
MKHSSISNRRDPPSCPLREIHLGTTVQGRPLTAFVLGEGPETTLVHGGCHGDEPQSIHVATQLLNYLRTKPDVLQGRSVVVMPSVNPDGAALAQRTNARHVDINRNFPASNWKRGASRKSRFYGGPDPASEPETKAVMGLLKATAPSKVIAIHTIDGARACNNFDGPAETLAELLSEHNQYPVEPNIGYATPGSFGAWAGIDLRIATLTLEMPAERSAHSCWRSNCEGLLAVIRANTGGPAGEEVSPDSA